MNYKILLRSFLAAGLCMAQCFGAAYGQSSGELSSTDQTLYHSPNPKVDAGATVKDMFSLNYASLFKLNLSEVSGIKGTVNSGGKIMLQVFAYDPGQTDGKGQVVYKSEITTTSTQQFSESVQDISVNIAPQAAQPWMETVRSNDVKRLAQSVPVYMPEGCSTYPKPGWLQSFSTPGLLPVDASGCGAYVRPFQPVVIEATLINSTLSSFKVPGISELTAAEAFVRSQSMAELKHLFENPAEYNYTFVAAHRGYWAEPGVPENTIEAFHRSIGLGADMIEMDIRMTKDSVPAAMHDDCISRLTTGPEGKFMKDITWAELSNAFVKDRFGSVTQFRVNSLEEILDAFGQTQLISLDLKDENALWDAAFVKCLRIAKEKGVLRNMILKGPKSKSTLLRLIAQAGVTLRDFYYTPVMYGSDSDWTLTDRLENWKKDFYPMMLSGDIKAVETHFKVSTDPLIRSGIVSWLQNNNIRIGAYSFVSDTCKGVIVMENGKLAPTVRQYMFDPNYDALTQPPQKNRFDGRGDVDWLMRMAGPDYIIYDRPDVLLSYLEAIGRRSKERKVITRIALPDTLVSTDQLSAAQKQAHPGIIESRKLIKFDGIALKISDVRNVTFFTPDTRQVPMNRDIITRGRNLFYDREGELETGTLKNPDPYQAYIPPAPPAQCVSCQQIYGSMTATDHKGKAYSARMKFPFYNLAEWSKKYPGYDIYLDANFWDTRGWSGEATAGSPTPFLEQRSEFMLPCTDTYGLWVSNGVMLSDTVEATDPSGRMGTGAFDTFIMYADNSVEIVPIAKIRQGYLNLVSLRRASDNNAIVHAIAGYDIVENGVALKTAEAGSKFNNEQLEKSRMIIGIKGNELVLVTVQFPELRVGEAAQLMKEYYGCTDAIFMDSGRSAAMITSVGTFPNLTAPVSPGIKAGSTPRGLDTAHLNRLYPNNHGVNVYRNLASFLAIKKK